ncbi:patatin-like phospholipase family protein, partial [Deferribacter abyssi]|uniref:patatin-like phospholipase family protein n=1 Tax=Deferribacter abyssi TaxID=213806 RepID=UPI003C143A4A
MFTRNKSIALSLGSGSAKGLAHIGVIRRLIERGYKIQAIAGSSIGAIIGSYFAFDKLKVYEEFVLSLNKAKVFSLFNINIIPNKGLMDGDKICDFFLKSLGDINIEDANIPLYIIATDLESGKPVVFNKGSLIKAVRASISIPGIFTPYRINGQILVDGGVSNPLPINVLYKKGFKKICAVDLNGKIKETIYDKIPNIISTLYRSFTIMNYNQTKYILSKYKPNILLTPPLDHIGMFDYHLAEEIISIGYDFASKTI